MSRVLIVSSDVVGPEMAGPAIRAWELGRLLAAEHPVTLAAPPPLPAELAGFRLVEARRSVVGAEVQKAEVVVVQGTALDAFPQLALSGKPLVVDLYDPYVLENLEVHAARGMAERLAIHEHDLETLVEQARLGDFFLCASERQRHFWLGLLTALGRVNPLTYEEDPELRRLLAIVPFGLPDRPLQPLGPALRGVVPGIGHDDFVLLWGGGIWNWFDPLTLLRAVAEVSRHHPGLRLVFMGTRHPNPSIPRMRRATEALELARRLGLEGRHAFFLDRWVPYREREGFLAEADVGVSLHLPTVETVFSFRTRVLDYLWAGLPMLVTEGDTMADLVAEAGLGLVVPPRDVDAAAAALRRLMEDDQLRGDCRQACLAVAQRYRWSAVAAPLLEFCRQPRRSPDAGHVGVARRLRRPGAARRALVAKAWRSLREEGPGRLLDRSYRYLRRRLT